MKPIRRAMGARICFPVYIIERSSYRRLFRGLRYFVPPLSIKDMIMARKVSERFVRGEYMFSGKDEEHV